MSRLFVVPAALLTWLVVKHTKLAVCAGFVVYLIAVIDWEKADWIVRQAARILF